MNLNVNIKEEVMDNLMATVKKESINDTTALANATTWQTANLQLKVQSEMKLNGQIKEKGDPNTGKLVKMEPLGSIERIDNLLQVKEEALHDDKESLTTFASKQSASFSIIGKWETCQCPGDCSDCIEANQSKETIGNVFSTFESLSGDDSGSEPEDWLWGESDGENVDASLTVLADSVSNFSIKEEPLPVEEESSTIFASTQSALPSIIIKGETCPCAGDCLDCLPKRSPCPECSKTFVSNSALIIHLRVHTGERPYVCAQCPKAFNHLGTLKRHQLTHQAVRSRPFRCTTEGCGKTFARKGDLTIHFRTHTEERPYKCDNCEKTFTTSFYLAVHFRSHTGERPFVCAQCPKAFKLMGTLTRHQLTHQAVRSRPFKCTTEGCGKDFTRKDKLKVHFRSHTGERPYKCDSCGKAFTRSGDLKVHLRTHTGDKPHQCPLCPKAYSSWSAAKYHQQTVHSIPP